MYKSTNQDKRDLISSRKPLGQTWHVSSEGSTGAIILLKANIHCSEPSEV